MWRHWTFAFGQHCPTTRFFRLIAPTIVRLLLLRIRIDFSACSSPQLLLHHDDGEVLRSATAYLRTLLQASWRPALRCVAARGWGCEPLFSPGFRELRLRCTEVHISAAGANTN